MGRAVALETLTTQPSPRLSIDGRTACARSIGACTFTSNVRRRRRRGKSTSGLVDGGRSVVDQDVERSFQRLDRLGHDPSPVIGISQVRRDNGDDPSSESSKLSAVSRREPANVGWCSGVRAVMATSAPSAASRCAMAAPMPRLAPVTRARRPRNAALPFRSGEGGRPRLPLGVPVGRDQTPGARAAALT